MSTGEGSDREQTGNRFEAYRADLVVVGSGVAGLSAALAAAGHGRTVLLVTKTALAGGSSAWARGGLAAVKGADDTPELHARDTVRVGRGLSDPEIVRVLTDAAPAEIDELIALGARFDRTEGRLALGREAGHSRHRIVHAGGDRTGEELVRTLIAAVRGSQRIRVAEHLFAERLLRGESGRVVGLAGTMDGRAVAAYGREVVLATGGAGQVFAHTTNPLEVTGDGIAMAAAAGALLAELEMVQFHPTALAVEHDGQPLPLLTEALRGAGAHLVDASGERFMLELHADAELAPRDVVARTLWRRAEAGRSNLLDLRPIGPLEELDRRFPSALEACREAGFDPSREPVPVTPAAHYLVGGVWTDGVGRTSLAGLWACGELAAVGIHGANRLASNSLVEGLVFGRRVADEIAASGSAGPRVEVLAPPAASAPGGSTLEVSNASGASDAGRFRALRRQVQDEMWREVGLERDESSLVSALERLDGLEAAALEAAGARPGRDAGELRNLIAVGRLIACSALLRRESRGCHTRSDFPDSDPAQQGRRIATAEQLTRAARRLTGGDRRRVSAAGAAS